METIKLLSSKIHRVKVTECNINYVGSIKIDELLLRLAGILPLQHVQIVNLNNGKRWETYVLPGKSGKGEVCPNGGGAYNAKPGDLLIIWSYVNKVKKEIMNEGHDALVVLVDDDNKIKEKIIQSIKPIGDNYSFVETRNEEAPILV